MNSIDKLAEYFAQFPGIGQRQAKRFVYFLLTKSPQFTVELITLMRELRANAQQCRRCMRHFINESSDGGALCSVCADESRDAGAVMVVSREADLEAIERSGTYSGQYFVLGETVPVLTQEPEKIVRSNELVGTLRERAQAGGVSEVILALPANPDGDHTADYLAGLLEPLSAELGFNISKLGRGISTGLELEYSDTETLKNALRNRS